VEINLLTFRKIIFFVILTTFLILGNFVSINAFKLDTDFNRNLILILMFSFLILFDFKYMKITEPILLKFILLWELFIISIIVSTVYHNEFLFMTLLIFGLFIPLVFINQNIKKYKNTILLSSFVSIIPVLINLERSNSFGMIISLACLCGIMFLFSKKRNIVSIFLSSLIGLIFIFLTGSRTAVIAYIITILLMYIINALKYKLSIKSIIVYSSLYLSFLLVFVSYIDNFIELIFNKRQNTDSNFLADRTIFWEGTFKNGMELLGNGKDYFMYTYSIGNSHNTFVEVLGIYGLVSFLLLILFFSYVFRLILITNNKIIYLSFFVFYILLGFAEDLLFLNSRLLTYIILLVLFLNMLLTEAIKSKNSLK